MLRILWFGETVDQKNFQTILPQTCAPTKIPLVSMGDRAEGQVCADPWARTPIGASGIFIFWFPLLSLYLVPSLLFSSLVTRKKRPRIPFVFILYHIVVLLSKFSYEARDMCDFGKPQKINNEKQFVFHKSGASWSVG